MPNKFEPTNDLEIIFEKALQDSAYAKDFYQKLGESQLFTIAFSSVDNASGKKNYAILELNITASNGDSIKLIPVFTSKDAADIVFEEMVEAKIDSEVISMRAPLLFKSIADATCPIIINLYTTLEKPLDLYEMRLIMLLDKAELIENRYGHNLCVEVIEQAVPRFKSIYKAISNYKSVEKAYLCMSGYLQVSESTSDHTFNLVVELTKDNSGDIRLIQADIDKIDTGYPIKVHFIQIHNENPIIEYCQNNIKPFYTASLLTKLARLFKK